MQTSAIIYSKLNLSNTAVLLYEKNQTTWQKAVLSCRVLEYEFPNTGGVVNTKNCNHNSTNLVIIIILVHLMFSIGRIIRKGDCSFPTIIVEKVKILESEAIMRNDRVHGIFEMLSSIKWQCISPTNIISSLLLLNLHLSIYILREF